tara:strand:+ start:301 stop:603 length:303 start_codon:yes stop_codon:yes gene_type:complete
MFIEFKYNKAVITKEPSDKRFRTESALLYAVKKELQSMGHDVVKKLMWKDGHLVDDTQYYLRERSWKFALYDDDYALRCLHKAFNQNGQVTLFYDYWGEL